MRNQNIKKKLRLPYKIKSNNIIIFIQMFVYILEVASWKHGTDVSNYNIRQFTVYFFHCERSVQPEILHEIHK